MIIDLQRFLANERPYWSELEAMLNRVESEPNLKMPIEQLRNFHLLYERTSADLAKITTFSSERETRRYLEGLVARAYGEIHETRKRTLFRSPVQWFLKTLPQTFRRYLKAFWLSLAITVAGCIFGGMAISLDPDSKPMLVGFSHLLGDPSKRVAQEENASTDRLANQKTTFSASLMTHNTRVSIAMLAMGFTYGIGTVIMLFYNGIILGAVAMDYIHAGQTTFLLGWLLPHGVIEIPAILIAGQAGLLLAGALIGWGRRIPLTSRMREITRDLVTLIFGCGLLLMWAGFVEAFLSQYHEPVIPYAAKISFGLIELALLILFLSKSGSKTKSSVDFPPR